jgi:Na+-driven multidrug efflux pump
MRLSTSVRISLLFSGLTTLLVVFFGVAILRFFATNWQQAERKLLTLPPQAVERMDERGMK